MIIRVKNFQLRCYFSRLEKRNGLCSQIYGTNKHILLWDFDHVSLKKLCENLSFLQYKYELPKIYILKTSISGYHAYCFKSYDLKDVIHILSDTIDIDDTYLRLGMVRGYYTLRFSGRQDGKPKLVKILESNFPESVSPIDITINEYYTNNKGVKNAKRR